MGSTQRCGDRLRIDVPESRKQATINFAQQAAGPNSNTVYAVTSVSGRSEAVRNQTATPQSTNTANSSTSGENGSSSPPQSPNTVHSDDELSQPNPFIPAGTKMYMLLCVNTNAKGASLRKLANVDVTDVHCGEEMFQKLQRTYYELRNSRNPLLVPKSMHYVKVCIYGFPNLSYKTLPTHLPSCNSCISKNLENAWEATRPTPSPPGRRL